VVHELPRPLAIVRLRLLLALARHGSAMYGADLGRAIGMDSRDPVSGHIRGAIRSGLLRSKLIPYGTLRRRRSYELTDEGTLFVRDFLAAADGYAQNAGAVATGSAAPRSESPERNNG
jgi:DNA-binding MarR family transcriptional regulator